MTRRPTGSRPHPGSVFITGGVQRKALAAALGLKRRGVEVTVGDPSHLALSLWSLVDHRVIYSVVVRVVGGGPRMSACPVGWHVTCRRQLPASATGTGLQRFAWGGRDDSGRSAPPGVYFLRVSDRRSLDTRRCVRTRRATGCSDLLARYASESASLSPVKTALWQGHFTFIRAPANSAWTEYIM